jgi:UDP-N-acetylmuramoyl-tripeptide--D-alanyl-D-alanine ligase
MGRADPFTGYSLLLRAIVFGAVPAFAVWQYFRLRRGLHVFQLEGYDASRLWSWCRSHPRRALFLRPLGAKKPLVMTGRAWRILAAALALNVLASLVTPGAAHLLLGGWPADVATWGLVSVGLFLGAPLLLLAGNALVAPVQRMVNARFLRAARDRLSEIDPVVVGITGSFGKTSTKAAVAGLISDPPAVLATPGSYNTPLGVSRTINEHLEPSHRFLVVEMGARRRGDIAELCRLVSPSVALLTAIGPAHLDTFGTLADVRAAKSEIVSGLAPGGIAVLNVDDPEVRSVAEGISDRRVIRYGLDPVGRPDVTARDVTTGPRGSSLTVVDATSKEQVAVSTRLLGRHALAHLLGGVAAAVAVGRSLSELAEAIASLEPVEHRLQLIEGTNGITVIDDAYNSNPQGAAAALEVLAAMPAAKRVVVTPGIVELGPLQPEANRELGAQAARVADAIIVVAPVNRAALSAGVRSAGNGALLVTVDSLKEAEDELGRLLAPGDAVLFENDLPDHYEG